MIEIVLLLACCCFIFIVVAAGVFLTRGKEGDECEGKDDNGNYEIDEDLKCVLKSCATGYYKSGKECLVDNSGATCVPTGTSDPQGTYLTTKIGGCELSSCKTGFVVDGTTCDSTLPSGQYVKLVHTALTSVINLAELEVFAKAGTTNLAAGKTVTSSQFHGGFPGSMLVDGNMTNFAHTLNEIADTEDYMLIDLGSVQEIEKIKITNRIGFGDRAIGIKAVILGADGTTVIKETAAITTDAATYTFTFPGGTAWV